MSNNKYFDVAGASPGPYAVPAVVSIDPATGLPVGGGTDRELVVSTYVAKNAFTGASVGDTITATQIIDVSGTPTTVSTIWRNQTTAADLAGAPSAANLTLVGSNALTNAELRATAVAMSSVDLGVQADAAASTDTGTFSVIAFIKRTMQNWTTLLSRIPAALGQSAAAASFPVTLSNENVQDLHLVGQSGQSATINNILLPTTAGAAWLDCSGYRSGSVQLITTASGGTGLFECTNDPGGANPIVFSFQNNLLNTFLSSVAFSSSSGNAVLVFPIPARYIRLRISVAITGGSTQAFTKLSQVSTGSGMALGSFQLTGNTSLASVDSKLPALSSGRVPVASGLVANPSANFTRPADTTAYAVGDLVANNTTAGSVTPMSFTAASVSGGTFSALKVRLKKTGTSITNAAFKLHLYTTSPTVTNGDNGAFLSNQAATWLGSFDITSMTVFSDGAAGNGVATVGSAISVILASGQIIYGLLEARGAYTPISGEVFTVILEELQD